MPGLRLNAPLPLECPFVFRFVSRLEAELVSDFAVEAAQRLAPNLALFTPTYAEYIFLKGRRVLADQMEYLIAHFPRSSPLHDRLRAYLS